jgi:hypothetical protein
MSAAGDGWTEPNLNFHSLRGMKMQTSPFRCLLALKKHFVKYALFWKKDRMLKTDKLLLENNGLSVKD